MSILTTLVYFWHFPCDMGPTWRMKMPNKIDEKNMTPAVLRGGWWEYSQSSTNVVDVNNNRCYEIQKKIWIISGLNDLIKTWSAQQQYYKLVSKTVFWLWLPWLPFKPESQPPVRAPTGPLRSKIASFRSFSYGQSKNISRNLSPQGRRRRLRRIKKMSNDLIIRPLRFSLCNSLFFRRWVWHN